LPTLFITGSKDKYYLHGLHKHLVIVLLASYFISLHMKQTLQAILLKPRSLLVIYIATAVIASVQLILLGTHAVTMPLAADIKMQSQQAQSTILQVTEYNNYIIFKRSFFHLLAGKNLYDIFPYEQWDYYKYSPTFSLFMGFLAYLPDIIGLSIWNILNALTVFMAIRLLPYTVKTQCLILLFAALELLTSMQNAQSNGLMCGLMIAAYGCMQRNKAIWATLWLVLATYIKVYGAVGFCLFLFYPGKPRFILYAIFWTVIMAILPLLVTPFHTLIWQYQNWVVLMKADAIASYGISVSGWLHSWFGIEAKTYITIAGLLLFLLPFARFRLYRNEVYKMLMLASMLIWVIIFNHKAESPTYVIAVAGVAIWYFAMPPTVWRRSLFWLTFIFTSLATTDIFPPYVRIHYLVPYTIKAVPCIIVWCAVLIDMLRLKQNEQLFNTQAHQPA